LGLRVSFREATSVGWKHDGAVLNGTFGRPGSSEQRSWRRFVIWQCIRIALVMVIVVVVYVLYHR
jgi:hypothetical protein